MRVNGHDADQESQQKPKAREWEPINETILRARFQSKFQEVSIIQCYAPTNPADREVKEEFYEQIQSVLERTPDRDIPIVLGDVNTKVGNDNSTREIIVGKAGLDTMNKNIELFTDFCEQNNLVIAGTVFPHRKILDKIHKVTWSSPDSRTENHIDHQIFPAGGEEPCKTLELIEVRTLDHTTLW